MHYRSILDLQTAIAGGLHRLPREIDLIVGVPRSGLLAANLLSLLINRPLADLDGYLAGRILASGQTRPSENPGFGRIKKVLVLDDSINVGTAMQQARDRVSSAGHHHEVTFAAVYGQRPEHEECDIVLEVLPQPRIFQWNLMHHNFIERACVDIDGVLCRDPTDEQNDDGERYLEFLLTASPLYSTTRRIKTLVTTRLEKYRRQTEQWLRENGIRYDELVMLDLPSKEERQRLGAHARFKGEHYKTSDAVLFLESDLEQARQIAQISGKPVISMETHTLFDRTNAWDESFQRGCNPGTVAYRPPLNRRVKRSVRAAVGDAAYSGLKQRWKRLRQQLES